MALDTKPLDMEKEFMEVLYLFFKHVCDLRLTDHVDLSAFFSIVIHPHLPNGASCQIWEFGFGLLIRRCGPRSEVVVQYEGERAVGVLGLDAAELVSVRHDRLRLGEGAEVKWAASRREYRFRRTRRRRAGRG